MTITLGLDIGSNSVGSAWVDTDAVEMCLGDSVFPSGVEDSDDKRGDPKNVARRGSRHGRTTVRRRAARKTRLREILREVGLLPCDWEQYDQLVRKNPWDLRRRGLSQPLTPHEFGRVLVHLNQRRGALGVQTDPEDDDKGKVKEAIDRTEKEMRERKAETFGQFMADWMDERRHSLPTTEGGRYHVQEHQRRNEGERGAREYRDPIRNRRDAFEFHATRDLIRKEFGELWDRQSQPGGALARLTFPTASVKDLDDLRRILDDPTRDHIWRQRGIIFGQRNTYWDAGTLGRCDLEPSERCAPKADRFASYYLVVETVNNIRIEDSVQGWRPLTIDQRAKVLALLRGPLGFHEKGQHKGKPKTGVSVTDIRFALDLGRASRSSPSLSLEKDPDRDINTDWFHREIVHGAIGEGLWNSWDEKKRESVNRAILKFDPKHEEDAQRFRDGAVSWWGCSPEQADRLVTAWRTRPKVEERTNLSRRAIRNILTVMDAAPDDPRYGFGHTGRWFTQVEARMLIAKDAENGHFRDVTTDRPLDKITRRRYATGAKGLTSRDRHYMRKHALKKGGEIIKDLEGRPIPALPPAPMLSNPVVRKAIHEVRDHIIAYLRKFRRKPDRVVIELAREARMGKKDADEYLARNRRRNRIKRSIIETEELGLGGLSANQQRQAVERVLLAVQQKGVCPLCGNTVITDCLTRKKAAAGDGCEIAHILPRSLGGPNGWSNAILAHAKCNRDMGQQTPRDWWGEQFKENIKWAEAIYKDRELPNRGEAEGQAEWPLYFDRREDNAKLSMFAKSVKDLAGFRESQRNDTRYAARQVMTYLADALFDGTGLPERGGERRIFASTGGWTGKLRREWGLFFDPHGFRAKGLTGEEEAARKEKDRGDHREHAIDALVIALADDSVKRRWDQRSAEAELNRIDEDVYAERNPIPPAGPWRSKEDFRERVRLAIFGEPGKPRPVAHRPVKRKIIGAFHEQTAYGPVTGSKTYFTNRIDAKRLTPNHLRVPEGWDAISAGLDGERLDEKQNKVIRGRLAGMPDPPPGKSGIVRDRTLRDRIRKCLRANRVDPDDFTKAQIKELCDANKLRQMRPDGIPIKSVVLLRTNADPVILQRRTPERANGLPDPKAARVHIGGNNHHIEIRQDGSGRWSGRITATYDVARTKLDGLRAVRDFLRTSGVQVRRRRRGEKQEPPGMPVRKLAPADRERIRQGIREIHERYPLVDRTDNAKKGGSFVLSLAEGEMIFGRRWNPKLKQAVGDPEYFVVAKLDRPNRIVFVAHWDARRAKGRKDANDEKVPFSEREDFAVTSADLKQCGPEPGQPPYKVRVDPLGRVRPLRKD